jgi:hypothetical protein
MFKKLIPVIAFALIAGPVFAADPAPATSTTTSSSGHHKKHHSSSSSSSKSHKSTPAPTAAPTPAPK